MAKVEHNNKEEKVPELNFWTALAYMQQLDLPKPLTALERSVWLALVEYCNSIGWKKTFYAKKEAIALKADVSYVSLWKILKRLDEIGLVKYKAGDGRNNASTFSIAFGKVVNKGFTTETLSDDKGLPKGFTTETLSDDKGLPKGFTTETLSDDKGLPKGFTTETPINTIPNTNNKTICEEQSSHTQGVIIELNEGEYIDSMKKTWEAYYSEKTGHKNPKTPTRNIKDLKEIYSALKDAMTNDSIEFNNSNLQSAFSWFLETGFSIRFVAKSFNLGAYKHCIQQIIDVKSGRMNSHLLKEFLGPDFIKNMEENFSRKNQPPPEPPKPKQPLPDYMRPDRPAYFKNMMDVDVKRYHPNLYEDHVKQKQKPTKNLTGADIHKNGVNSETDYSSMP
jgi:hypothetical protein